MVTIERHKTAISRKSLSSPMRMMVEHSIITPDTTVLDYGCGRGDDVAALKAMGINVTGYDPYYCKDTPPQKANVVNLGFVLNTIEDKKERTAVLQDAYSFAEDFLMVALRLAPADTKHNGTPYKDGIITSRNTFQKYFTRVEAVKYIEETLQAEVRVFGHGVFLVEADYYLFG